MFSEAQIGIQIKQITSPWFRYFLTYDSATALRKVTCAVLVHNGELDKQVATSTSKSTNGLDSTISSKPLKPAPSPNMRRSKRQCPR